MVEENGVTQVVCCGVATSAGVESTARFAQELGYNVTLASDAMTDMSPEAHDNSIKRIFPRLGETGTTAEIVALVEKAERTMNWATRSRISSADFSRQRPAALHQRADGPRISVAVREAARRGIFPPRPSTSFGALSILPSLMRFGARRRF
ncbi:MAG: isochorismatase family protein [Rhizomicrobium sp.]